MSPVFLEHIFTPALSKEPHAFTTIFDHLISATHQQ
jgi:hypothetical protein